jgi:hypothetical protein
MPWRTATVFDPETVAMLEQVLKDACRWLTGNDGKEPDESTRTAIALRIMECARGGDQSSKDRDLCAGRPHPAITAEPKEAPTAGREAGARKIRGGEF